MVDNIASNNIASEVERELTGKLRFMQFQTIYLNSGKPIIYALDGSGQLWWCLHEDKNTWGTWNKITQEMENG